MNRQQTNSLARDIAKLAWRHFGTPDTPRAKPAKGDREQTGKPSKARAASVKTKRVPCAVEDYEVLTVQELADRVCTTPTQIYLDAKNGLIIRKRGGRVRILGKDYNDWWRTAPAREVSGPEEEPDHDQGEQ